MKILWFEIKKIKKPVPHSESGLKKLFGEDDRPRYIDEMGNIDLEKVDKIKFTIDDLMKAKAKGRKK